jgi:hypothetical protein
MIDSRNVSGSYLPLLPGMSVDLVVTGYFARSESYSVYNEGTGLVDTKTLINGFYVEDTEAGEITKIEGKAAVKYTHLKARENTIWFIARTEVGGEPEKGFFKVVYIPIHDHASIVTGGPAHGTYYSEGSRQVQEEGS